MSRFLHCFLFFIIDTVIVVLLTGDRLGWRLCLGSCCQKLRSVWSSSSHWSSGYRTSDTGKKSLWIGAIDSPAGSVPKAPALRKQIQIQVLNIYKNQNGDIFDLLPTCLIFLSIFLMLFLKTTFQIFGDNYHVPMLQAFSDSLTNTLLNTYWTPL